MVCINQRLITLLTSENSSLDNVPLLTLHLIATALSSLHLYVSSVPLTFSKAQSISLQSVTNASFRLGYFILMEIRILSPDRDTCVMYQRILYVNVLHIYQYIHI